MYLLFVSCAAFEVIKLLGKSPVGSELSNRYGDDNHLQLSTFNRTLLVVNGRWQLVGNLVDTAGAIENIIKKAGTNTTAKESMPFLCVVNPLRHGKSRLLDQLFLGDAKVLVVSITYTGTEIEDACSVLLYFGFAFFAVCFNPKSLSLPCDQSLY